MTEVLLSAVVGGVLVSFGVLLGYALAQPPKRPNPKPPET